MRKCLWTALALLVLGACQAEEDGESRQERAVPVAMARVEQRDLAETVRGIGTLEAPEDVQVAAEAPGRVVGVHFEPGQRVAAGDLLYTLESAAVRRAIEARRAALAEARAEQKNARRAYRRREELLAEGFIAEETRDEARTAAATARARVERLEAEIKRLQQELQDTRIRAPLDGTAGERLVDVGDFADTGQVLVSLVGTGGLQVAFTVPERYADRVRVGQEVKVRPAARPEGAVAGTVFFVSPAIDPAARDLLVKARLAEGEGLRPGGFAAVDLVVGMRRDALVVPEEALVPTRKGYRVFVVEEGRARARSVQVGLRRPGLAEISGEVAAGATVIRSGHIDVADGDRVRPLGSSGGDSGAGR